MDLLDRLDRVASQDFLDCRELMVFLATMAILEGPDPRETRDHRGTPDLLASLDPGVSKET